LQQVGIGDVARHLSPQHKVNQVLVLPHEAILADPAAGLGAAKHGWPAKSFAYTIDMNTSM
jgi:hypothetical protein